MDPGVRLVIFVIVLISLLSLVYQSFISIYPISNVKPNLECPPDSVCPSLFRPIFPANQPLSDYLSGETPVSRGDTPWELYGAPTPQQAHERDEKRSRLFVGRVIENDIWPLMSPCRSRINLIRLLDSSTDFTAIKIPKNISVNWDAEEKALLSIVSSITTDELESTKIESRRSPPDELEILELWAPYRILNNTEHRQILNILGHTKKRSLIFSVPLDLPTLALAKSYIGYLTNIALARQVVWRETMALGSRWTFLLSPNHFISSEGWKYLASAIGAAERNEIEFIFVPTFKLIESSGVEDLNNLGGIRQIATRLIRLPPQVMVRYSAPMEAFIQHLSTEGMKSWITALNQLVTNNSSLVACSASFSRHLTPAPQHVGTDVFSIAMSLSAEDIRLAEHCGYVIELENYPQYQDNSLCFLDPPKVGSQRVSEMSLATDSIIREKYLKTAAEVLQRFVELSLGAAP